VSLLPAPLSPKRLGRWTRVGFVVLPLLAASLVATALYLLLVLQNMSSSTQESAQDSGQWVVYQLERENNRFFYTLMRHAKGEAASPSQPPPSWGDVQIRFDILYSRLVSLQGSSLSHMVSDLGVVSTHAEEIGRLINAMDALLQQGRPATLARLTDMQSLSEQLRGLAEDMLLEIVDYRGKSITEVRQRQIDIYRQITLLVLLLIGAVATFVALLLRQMIAVQNAYEQVDSLAGQLRASAQKAEDASRSKSMFLANMSHEIRTPMNAILGMLQLLQGTGLKTRQEDYVDKAGVSARSLLGILNDILDFSKVEAGKMVLDPQPFSLNQLLRELATILSNNLGKKRLELLFDIDPAIPDVLVGDALRLKQVLINLAGNAVKFTSEGEVRLSIQLMSASADQPRVRFCVSDTGIGISPEQQARIFEGFSQAEASTSRRFGGTGLGLAISRRLVGLMGGELQLSSEPGQGSRFEFTLNLPEGTASNDHTLLEHPSLTALHALVVAQAPGTRSLLARSATELGWVVNTAPDGETALAQLEAWKARNEPCDVVFVDWLLPGLDGWTTAQRVRDAGFPLVVMVTSNPQDMLEGRSTEDVAQTGSFLTKPFTRRMVFETVMAKRNELRGATKESEAPMGATSKPLYGLRLLVVEDNPINQQVAQELLSGAGARVSLAENGREGVQAVRDALEPFDLVLMDMQMPVMDGLQATRAIRQELRQTDLVIVAMTANAMPADRVACLAAGMTDHVGKPFDIKELVSLISRYCAKRLQTIGPAPASARLSEPATRQTAQPSRHRVAVLPCRDELHTDEALARMDGDEKLYAQILQGYLRDAPQMVARALQALKPASGAGAPAHSVHAALLLAAQELHGLKGLSATVGANTYAQAVTAAEQHLKTVAAQVQALAGGTLTNPLFNAFQSCQTECLALQQGYERVLQAATQVLASQPVNLDDMPGEEPRLNTLALTQDLQQLERLLVNADMASIELHETLLKHHGSAGQELLADLNTAMELLDFDAARLALEQVLAILADAVGSSQQAA
jgi:two-component system, sensor histidine kinase and response regulator